MNVGPRISCVQYLWNLLWCSPLLTVALELLRDNLGGMKKVMISDRCWDPALFVGKSGHLDWVGRLTLVRYFCVSGSLLVWLMLG